LVSRRNRGFFTVDHVVVADALHFQTQIGRTRATAWLGQRDCQQYVSLSELGEPGFDDLRLAVMRKNLPI